MLGALCVSLSTGMLLKAMYRSVGLTSVTENVALKEGSSMQGKARRAYVGWNFEAAIGIRSFREFV